MVRNLVTKLEETFLSLLLVAMTLLVFVEVVMRFGFNTGIHWAQEMTLLLAAWFVLYGASYGIKVGAHIGVDVFVKMLPRNAHRFSLCSRSVCVWCTAACCYTAHGSI